MAQKKQKYTQVWLATVHFTIFCTDLQFQQSRLVRMITEMSFPCLETMKFAQTNVNTCSIHKQKWRNEMPK